MTLLNLPNLIAPRLEAFAAQAKEWLEQHFLTLLIIFFYIMTALTYSVLQVQFSSFDTGKFMFLFAAAAVTDALDSTSSHETGVPPHGRVRHVANACGDVDPPGERLSPWIRSSGYADR